VTTARVTRWGRRCGATNRRSGVQNAMARNPLVREREAAIVGVVVGCAERRFLFFKNRVHRVGAE
jgi:hypothetical protein